MRDTIVLVATNGELLAGDLKDQRPKGVERRKVLEPGAGPEARVGVDDAAEHRVGLAKKGLRLAVGQRCFSAGHSLSSRS
jgi:hypothetical protein